MAQTQIGAVHDLKVIDPKTIPHVLMEGELGAALEWMVHDPKTGKVQEHVIKKSESFVQQFLRLMYVTMALRPDRYPTSITDTGNAARDIEGCAAEAVGEWDLTGMCSLESRSSRLG